MGGRERVPRDWSAFYFLFLFFLDFLVMPKNKERREREKTTRYVRL
jgi:hypothetical protein